MKNSPIVKSGKNIKKIFLVLLISNAKRFIQAATKAKICKIRRK